MKKRIIAAIVIFFASALTIIYFIPSYDQKEVLILSKVIHAAQELYSPAEWQRWNPALKKDCLENPGACTVNNNPDHNSFTIQTPQGGISVAVHGALFDILQTGTNGSAFYSYTLIPSLHDDSTRLIVTEKRSLLVSLLSSLSTNSVAFKDADSLKKFLETPSGYYGFPLEISPIIDTLVVTTHKRIAMVNRAVELKDMYSSLNDLIKANHLIISHPYIAHYQPAGKDSIDLVAAIPVEKKLPRNSVKTNISFMEMPRAGRMVVGYYKGRYGDRIKLYTAIDRFIGDKSLKKIAAVYEEYLNNTVPENDDTMVEIRICSPIL